MKKSEGWYSNPTQIYWACKALIEGRTLTHRTEIREVRGWRLAAIVEKLRNRYGWPIVAQYRGPENIAYYRLSPDADISRLRFPPSAASLANGGAS